MKLGHVSEKCLIELGKQNFLCGDKVEKLRFCEHHVYPKLAKQSSMLVNKEQKELFIMFVLISEDHLRLPLNLVQGISCQLWIITHKNYGSTIRKPKMNHLKTSKTGKLLLGIKQK